MTKVYCKHCEMCIGVKTEEGYYDIEIVDNVVGYGQLIGKEIPGDAKCIECGIRLDVVEVDE